MKRYLAICFYSLIFLSLFLDFISGCTVAMISGKGTPDGKPLLWKNRDSDYDANMLRYFRGSKYNFIGLINSSDREGKEVWAGINSSGFCIINSASYNLNLDEKKKTEKDDSYSFPKDQEGYLMKEVLGICSSVDDFEKLLQETNGMRGVEANFGVIDADGGAAFFETDNNHFTKFDANDTKLAPFGYILRTNYSYTGNREDIAGLIRFERIATLFSNKFSSGGISLEWILQTASRDMVNNITGIDPLRYDLPGNTDDQRFFYMHDSITRRSNCSTVVFQGVRKGESPARSIMWTRLGHSLCSVALPVWLSAGDNLGILQGEDNAPIDIIALTLLKMIFPYDIGSKYRYMNLAPLVNDNGTGFLSKLINIEKIILQQTYLQLGTDKDAREIQSNMQRLFKESILKEFPGEAEKAGF